ncbi:MAG: hypothetical protein HOO91_17120 [Bacteroidales bacterium]|nr:hypothetical protein [Bacteroidales bacterium]
MKSIRYILSIILIFGFIQSKGQYLISSQSTDNPVYSGDTIILELTSYYGNVYWQKTKDLNNWETIDGATSGTLKLVPKTSAYYRAEVIAGTCTSAYSDTIPINVLTKGTIGPAGGTISTSDGAYVKIEPNILTRDIEIVIQYISSQDVSKELQNGDPNTSLRAIGGFVVSISNDQLSNISYHVPCEIGIPVSTELKFDYNEKSNIYPLLITDQFYNMDTKVSRGKNSISGLTYIGLGISAISIMNNINYSTTIIGDISTIIDKKLMNVFEDSENTRIEDCQSLEAKILEVLSNFNSQTLDAIKMQLPSYTTSNNDPLNILAGNTKTCNLNINKEVTVPLNLKIDPINLYLYDKIFFTIETTILEANLEYTDLKLKIEVPSLAEIQTPVIYDEQSSSYVINVLGKQNGTTRMLGAEQHITAKVKLNFNINLNGICPEHDDNFSIDASTLSNIFLFEPIEIKVKGSIYDGHLYYKSFKGFNWPDAKTYCESISGHLVIISSLDENNFVNSLCDPSGETVSIGLTDVGQEGIWHWVDGTLCSTVDWHYNNPNCITGNNEMDWAACNCKTVTNYLYANWKSCEPNNMNGIEDYGQMGSDGTWNDVGNGEQRFIIEWDYIPGDEVLNKLMLE